MKQQNILAEYPPPWTVEHLQVYPGEDTKSWPILIDSTGRQILIKHNSELCHLIASAVNETAGLNPDSEDLY